MHKNSILTILCALLCCGTAKGQDRIRYNHPGLTVDLGVGLWAWPLPMDYDGDGDYDLVVTCPDKPYNGTYFFENPGGDKKMPVFKPGKRISHGPKNAQVSQVNGKSIVTTPSRLHEKFINTEFKTSRTVPVAAKFHRGRMGQRLRQGGKLDQRSTPRVCFPHQEYRDRKKLQVRQS